MIKTESPPQRNYLTILKVKGVSSFYISHDIKNKPNAEIKSSISQNLVLNAKLIETDSKKVKVCMRAKIDLTAIDDNYHVPFYCRINKERRNQSTNSDSYIYFSAYIPIWLYTTLLQILLQNRKPAYFHLWGGDFFRCYADITTWIISDSLDV